MRKGKLEVKCGFDLYRKVTLERMSSTKNHVVDGLQTQFISWSFLM
jgi:hypothetical protein